MGLPIPVPDSPIKWGGWKNYSSTNPYERLCLDFESAPTEEQIQENYRLLLIWWQKKLPLKNQPSNPMAQLLRGGMDEAPQKLAEASALLLDPAARAALDASLRDVVKEHASAELRKLLDFTLTSGTLAPDEERNLHAAGQALGLSVDEVTRLINDELENSGSQRLTPVVAPPAAVIASTVAVDIEPLSSRDEFLRLLRLSSIDNITDDQRDAFCNMGEALGLTGGEAEDVIDDYLDERMHALSPRQTARAPITTKPTGQRAPLLPKMTEQRGTATPAIAPLDKPITSSPLSAQRSSLPVVAAALRAKQGSHAFISSEQLAEERRANLDFTNSIGLPMLFVSSGSFIMGSDTPDATPLEQPLSPTNISALYMARWPVTTAQYEAFAPQHRIRRAPWANDHHPVLYVSALDAARFCEWLSTKERRRYRLPTEAEWEYAAKGGQQRTFPWGESLPGHDLANFADANTPFPWADHTVNAGFAETSPVGSFPRGTSPFGMEDMAGNVWEWCLDGISNYPGRERSNPRGPLDGPKRVYRGGSWRSRLASLRTSARSFNMPHYTANDISFRIVCEIPGGARQ